MMDFSRTPITEMHLGKFLDSMEVRSWKLIFRTEVCLRTADLQITMHRNNENEIAKSIDELMTQGSIVLRANFPDFDMLDAMIASALKKLFNTQTHFRKRVSVEEQGAQKNNQFLQGRQIVFMICEYLRAIGAYEAVQRLSDLFTLSLQNDDVQDSDVRWAQALRSVSELPSDVILEEVNKSFLQDSDQFRLLLALYYQETARNNGKPNCPRLKTAVKLHMGQILRT